MLYDCTLMEKKMKKKKNYLKINERDKEVEISCSMSITKYSEFE